MNWISKFLKKTDTKPSAPKIPAPALPSRPAEDIEGLRALLAATADDGERRQLATRLGHALADRAQLPRSEDPPEVRVEAICHAPDKTLALAWLAQLEGDAWLGEVAIRAHGAEARLAAARRIETNATLELVSQSSRDKDKRVYRHCADLLRQRRQAEVSTRRTQEIAAELRGLLETAPLPLSRLLELKKELGALEESGGPCAECHGLMEQSLVRVRQETEALRDLHGHQGAALALAAECAGAAWPWTERMGAWRVRFDALSQISAGLPAWLANQAGARALAASLGEIESRLAALAADDERARACEGFLAALEAGSPPEGDAEEVWAVLAKPDHPDIRPPLDSRWESLHARLHPVAVAETPAGPEPAPVQRSRPQPKVDQDAMRGLLDKLEQAIGAGHLIDADAAAKQIKASLAGKSLPGALESRWHSLQAQVETLRGWARWGTEQAREKLIVAAGELLVGERDVEELAAAIPALREEWKRLNAHAPSGKGQWENFDATLEKAYEPVAAHRAEQAARQAEARAAKEALCTGWEAALAGGQADQQADLKSVEALRGEMTKLWRAAPQAGFRDERALRKRFDTLIGAIDQRLDAARLAEFARREQLILAAETLKDQTDPRRAIAEAKALQQSWSKQASPIRLKRGDEQKLWQRFRAACDVVFARLDAQRAEEAAEHQQQAQSRRKLLDAFAATLVGNDAGEIKRALNQFRAAWDGAKPADKPGRREYSERHPDKRSDKSAQKPADEQEALARDLQQQAQRRLDELRQAKQRERFDLLARKSALAERVEAAVLAAEPVEAVIAEVKQAWENLPGLPGKTESILARRLAGANAVTPAQWAAGREARDALLLDLEIALGLPSPAPYAEVRRERQLERLQSRFGNAPEQQVEPEEMLARWYATPAPPVANSYSRIAAVVSLLAEKTAPDRER